MEHNSANDLPAWLPWLLGVIVLVALGYLAIVLTSPNTPNIENQNKQVQAAGISTPPTPFTLTVPTATPVPNTCVPATLATSLAGTSACIEFTVGYTHTSSRGQMYLDQYQNYTSGFSVWIPAGYSFGPAALRQYNGKKIDATGLITIYRDAPEIKVTSASQLSAPN